MSELTFCVPTIRVVLRKLLQIVFEQHLVARNPLHRLQHVVLQRQGATHLLTLSKKIIQEMFFTVKITRMSFFTYTRLERN